MTDLPDLSPFGALASAFATDPRKESQGAWVSHDSGIDLRIKRSTDFDYIKAVRKAAKPYRDIPGQLPPEIEFKVKVQAASQQLVTDWRVTPVDPDEQDVVDEEFRKPVPVLPTFSAERVKAAMLAMPDLYRWVVEQAENRENYRLEQVAADAGNFSGSSVGSGSGADPSEPPLSSAAPRGEIAPPPQPYAPN